MFLANNENFEFKLKDKSFFYILIAYLESNKDKYKIELIGITKDSAKTLCTQNKNELIIVIGGMVE